MIVSHDWRFIFLKTRKTAGSSVELALSRICGPLDIITPLMPAEEQSLRSGRGPQHYIRKGGPPRRIRSDGLPRVDLDTDFYNHMRAERIREYVGPRIWRSYFKAGFVRNPWDRMVSSFHWRWIKEQDKSPAAFKRYLVAYEKDQQPLWSTLSIDGTLALDFVGRFESLELEFRRMLDQIGIREPLILPFAKTETRPADARDYRIFYDEESKAAVAKHAARDIAEFGYAF